MQYDLIANASEEQQREILAGLRAYNRAASPQFYAKLESSVTPLTFFARHDDGSFAGGLIGRIALSWLITEILFVAESARGQRIGSELMRRAEAEGIAHGCTRAYVDTMAWQARGFYEKLGYRVAGELPDWDSHGHSKYFMIKDLSPHDPRCN